MSIFTQSSRLTVVTLVASALITLITGCQQSNENGSASNASQATANSASGADRTLRIATEGTYKPFSFSKPDGTFSGFDVDITRALCEDMKARCEISPQEWDGILPGLLAKKFDIVVSALSVTPERQAQVDFTDPYFDNTLVFVAKKDSAFDPSNVSMIDNHPIAVQRSTLSTQWLDKNHPKAKQNLYENLDNAFMDVATGRSDAMISDKAPALYWLQSPEGKAFEVKGKDIDVNDHMAIAVRKGDPLREQLNTAIAHIKANGTYDKIYQQYFGEVSTKPASAVIVTVSTVSSGVTPTATASHTAVTQ